MGERITCDPIILKKQARSKLPVIQGEYQVSGGCIEYHFCMLVHLTVIMYVYDFRGSYSADCAGWCSST